VQVTNRKQICKYYLKHWFFVDVLACFPSGYISELLSDNSAGGGQNSAANLRGVKMIRLLRLAKMLRLLRMKKMLLRYADELAKIMRGLKFIGVVLMVLFICHILVRRRRRRP
jgi:hypothetical protein